MNEEFLNPGTFIQMAAAAEAEAKKIGVGVTLSIADENGNLRYLQRFGDAILPSVEISQNKAYTAATVRMSTAEFGYIAQPGAPAYGINMTHSRLVIFGGGLPLKYKGRTVGGIGVSGGSVEEDEKIAGKVLEVFRSMTQRP